MYMCTTWGAKEKDQRSKEKDCPGSSTCPGLYHFILLSTVDVTHKKVANEYLIIILKHT